MRPLILLAPVCFAVTVGCSASIKGEVDGETVPTLFSALFTEDEDELGSDTLTSVSGIGLSLLDGCNGMAKRQESTNELTKQLNDDLEDESDEDKIKDALDAFATGIVDYDKANVPTDYWALSLGASAVDKDDIDGSDPKIDVSDPELDAKVFAFLSVCRVNDHPEVDTDENDLPIVKVDQDCFGAIEADLQIVKWEEGQAFEATATATLGDFANLEPGDEPNDVGEVELSLSAGFCQPLTDAQDDAEKIAQDAQPG
jgi:hypothetical protein